MYINKGKNFMILDITPLELSLIKDSFTAGMSQIANILTKPEDPKKLNGKRIERPDEEICSVLGAPKEQGEEIRKALNRNYNFFAKHIKKILSYAEKKPEA